MNHYPHHLTNPMRRERLVDLAKFRKSAVAADVSSPVVEDEVPHSPEEVASGGASDAEPLQ
jgi:hypothetical protein